MPATVEAVNVTELIDERPLGTYQFVIIAICTFVALIDRSIRKPLAQLDR